MILLLLTGSLAWSAIGSLETLADANATVRDGTAEVILTNAPAHEIASGMELRMENDTFMISSVGNDEHGNTAGYAYVTLPDVSYDARVIIDSVSPLSFLPSA